MTSKIEINIKVSDTEYKTFKYYSPDVNHKLIVVYKATCSSAELLVFFTNKTISRFHEQQLILTDRQMMSIPGIVTVTCVANETKKKQMFSMSKLAHKT